MSCAPPRLPDQQVDGHLQNANADRHDVGIRQEFMPRGSRMKRIAGILGEDGRRGGGHLC